LKQEIKDAIAALRQGRPPERYERNLGTVGVAGQIRLLEACAVVIGAGGLGGTAVELLARMGVGRIRIIDGDTFAPHNLNRQVMATEQNLGRNKAVCAACRVRSINSQIEVEAVPEMFSSDNAEKFLSGANVALDALDNISGRLLLSRTAKKLKIPLVHAAIAGFTGQVTTVFPDDPGLERLYGQSGGHERGIEAALGNPAATPAFAAAMQVQEAVKIITGVGEPLRNQLFFFDLENNAFERIMLS